MTTHSSGPTRSSHRGPAPLRSASRLAASLLAASLLAALAGCAPMSTAALPLVPADTTVYLGAEQERVLVRSRKYRVQRAYDRITGRTTVSLPLLGGGGLSADGARLVVSFSHPGDTLVEPPAAVQVTLDWEDHSGGTYYASAPSAHFLVDDSVRFEAPGRDYTRYVDRSLLQLVFNDSTFRQSVVLDVPREDFRRMAMASRVVEGRLATGWTFRLTAEHLLALRRLEKEMDGAQEAAQEAAR